MNKIEENDKQLKSTFSLVNNDEKPMMPSSPEEVDPYWTFWTKLITEMIGCENVSQEDINLYLSGNITVEEFYDKYRMKNTSFNEED